MPKLVVRRFSISLDGYGAGPTRASTTRSAWAAPGCMSGCSKPRTAVRCSVWRMATRGSTAFMVRGDAGIGATIMGRNMFGPIRGPWADEEWKGWWGDDPPYHHPVFVLTHHPRAPITMQGGTTFHFVDDGIEAALERAFDAAGGKDVRLGGGAATIQQYLRAGLIDELHLAIVPILLGQRRAAVRHLDGGPTATSASSSSARPPSPTSALPERNRPRAAHNHRSGRFRRTARVWKLGSAPSSMPQ